MKKLKTNPILHIIRALALLFVAALFFSPTAARAAGADHPAPSVIHDYLLIMNNNSADVTMRFMVSPELVTQVYRSTIDKNNDAVTSDEEQAAWVANYQKNVQFQIDGKVVPFQLTGAEKLSREAMLLSMQRSITVTMRLDFPPLEPSTDAKPVQHHIILSDSANYMGYDEYYANFQDGNGVTVTTHDLTNPTNPATFEAIFEIDPAAVTAAQQPAAPATQAQQPSVAGQEPSGGILLAQLDDFLQQPSANIPFAILIFLLAVGVGALHALTPGHGKTVVAAYLTGTRGRVKDAVILGGVVTLTHTSSVVLLGLGLLLLNNFVTPRFLLPLLQVISGFLVLAMGLWLLIQRYRQARMAQPVEAPVTGMALAEAGAGAGFEQTQVAATQYHSNNDHAHTHGPGGHTHSYGGLAHSHAVPSDTKLANLIGLGISGGLVPCPDALSIMLLAAWFSQIGFGLALVASFSIGLAATLIAIGILMVKAKSLLERLIPGGPDHNPIWITWLPVVSAVIVTGLGVILMLEAIFGLKWA